MHKAQEDAQELSFLRFVAGTRIIVPRNIYQSEVVRSQAGYNCGWTICGIATGSKGKMSAATCHSDVRSLPSDCRKVLLICLGVVLERPDKAPLSPSWHFYGMQHNNYSVDSGTRLQVKPAWVKPRVFTGIFVPLAVGFDSWVSGRRMQHLADSRER